MAVGPSVLKRELFGAQPRIRAQVSGRTIERQQRLLGIPPIGVTMPGVGSILKDISDRLLDKFLPTAVQTRPFPGPGLPAPLPTPAPTPAPGPMFGGGLPRGAVEPIIGPSGMPECPCGFHFVKSGAGYCVRNRRMNPLNPRALNRASRRVGGFARAVKRARKLKQVCRNL